jgi:hypothetical protein
MTAGVRPLIQTCLNTNRSWASLLRRLPNQHHGGTGQYRRESITFGNPRAIQPDLTVSFARFPVSGKHWGAQLKGMRGGWSPPNVILPSTLDRSKPSASQRTRTQPKCSPAVCSNNRGVRRSRIRNGRRRRAASSHSPGWCTHGPTRGSGEFGSWCFPVVAAKVIGRCRHLCT